MKLTHTLAAVALLSGLASAQQPFNHDPSGHGQTPPASSVSQPSQSERKSDFSPAGSTIQKQFKTTDSVGKKDQPFELERHYMLKRDPFMKKK